MEKDKIILLILENVEIVQNLIIAIFLIFLHFKNRKKSMLALAMYFLFYGIASTIQIGVYFNYITNNLYVFPSALHFIAYSFFYTHINSLLINSSKEKTQRIFTIGIIAFLIGITISFCSFFIQNSVIYLIGGFYDIFAFLFLISVTIFLIFNIKKHNNLVENQYSYTENRKLQFLFYWTIGFLIHLLSFLVIDFFEASTVLEKIIQTIISFIWTLGLVYNVLLHQISVNLFEEKQTYVENSSDKIKEEVPQGNNSIKNETNKAHSDLFEKIKQQIETNELFLNAEFTVANLADLVGEHPKLVSQVINELSEQNFNTFINNYRVIYAKNMLLDTKNKHLNIEGIGNLSGFKSNSSFYTSFNKHLNCTPLQFQKKHHS